MQLHVKSENFKFLANLLEEDVRQSAGVSLFNFSEIEKTWDGYWAWALGPAAGLENSNAALGDIEVFYRFRAPMPGSRVRVSLDGEVVREVVIEREHQEIRGKVLIQGKGLWALEFASDCWNTEGGTFAPDDVRPLALCFSILKFQKVQAIRSPKNLAGKICPIPFSRLDIAPCCREWQREELFMESDGPEDFFGSSFSDPWNGTAARKMRESILDGSYRYCDLSSCITKHYDLDKLEHSSEIEMPLSPANIAAIRAGDSVLPEGPGSFSVHLDSRCNLKCGSCRADYITELDPDRAIRIQTMDRLLALYRSDIRILTVATDGEVFFSPYLRRVLKEATPDRYPSLQFVNLFSNGVLCDEKNFESLRPGTDYVKRVKISIDAGDAETYKEVRGGDWRRLISNLQWLSKLRISGRIEHLRLNFTLRAANFASLPAFFQLAEDLRVDEVYVSKLLPWLRMRIDFNGEGIAEDEHPRHGEFKALWSDLIHRKWSFEVTTNLGR